MGRVGDKVAVVTGAANGLGRAIAERLAGEGARVVLGDIDAAGLERAVAGIAQVGGEAVSTVGDVTEEEPAARLIEAAVARWGRLDILVNNVGGSRNARIWEMTAADWDFTLRLNLRSQFLMCRAVVNLMLEQEPDGQGIRGAILNMTSILAFHPSPAQRIGSPFCRSRSARPRA